MDKSRAYKLRRRVNDALRDCAVAETSKCARRVMRDFFESASDTDMDIMRYLLAELAVCMFHGFSNFAMDEEDAGDMSDANEPRKDDDDEGRNRDRPIELPPSRLGTVPPPTPSHYDHPDKNYKYDDYSDDDNDSNAYSTYFDAESTTGPEPDGQHPTSNQGTEEKWAQALSGDMSRSSQQQSESPDRSNVTCNDLFQTLLSNASSVVIPKVPSTLSSTASVVSSDSDLPSQLPPSHTQDSPSSSPRFTPSNEFEPAVYDDEDDVYKNDDYEDDNKEEDAEHRDEQSGSSVSTVDLVSREPDMLRTVSDLTVDSPWEAVRRSRAGSGADVLYGPRRLRNILESCIAQVLAKAVEEQSTTPKKSHNRQFYVTEALVFTVSILRKICRAVSIELSLELRTPFSPDHMPPTSSSSGALNLSGIPAPSPVARDISTLIWPVISAFVGANESEEMVSIIVDMLEAHILERKLFPAFPAESSLPSTEQTSNAMDLSVRTAQGSAPAYDEFQEGLEDEPDEYATDAVSEEGRPLRSTDDQSEPGRAQADLVGQYVDSIRGERRDIEQKSESALSSSRECTDGTPRSPDYQGYGADHGSYSTSKSSQIKKQDQHAWEMPASPLDSLFRQTLGALGSPFKMPPALSDDINDSTSQGSSSEEERDVLEDYYDDMAESGPLENGDDTYQDSIGEDGEDSSQSPDSSRIMTMVSMSTAAAVVGSDELSAPSSDDESSAVSESSDEDDDIDDNGIGVDDLPDDFAVEFLNSSGGRMSGGSHYEPDAFDLDSLEEQLQTHESPSARLPGRQPSIDEILIAECLDNLIVLPHGESPISSPDIRKTSRRSSPGQKVNTHRTTPGDVKGSPKYRERDPCTSSDEDDGDVTDDEDTNAVHSLVTDAAVASVSGEILDALDDKDSVDDSNEGSQDNGLNLPSSGSNASFDRSNRHIPPSPYPTDAYGFHGQIPFPRDMVQRVESVDEIIGDADDNSSASSDMYVDPIDLVEQQMVSFENELSSPTGPSNLSIRSLTSDDEREDDRRLFNEIMATAPLSSEKGKEEDVAYMSNLMRSTLNQSDDQEELDLIQLISSRAVENVSSRLENILQHAEGTDEKDEVARSQLHLQTFQQRAAAYLASSDTMETGSDIVATAPEGHHTDIRFDAVGLAVSGDDSSDLAPHRFGDDNIPDFVLRALESGMADYLPVTSSDELNKQFTNSFRELMQYYSSESTASTLSSANKVEEPMLPVPNGKHKVAKKSSKKIVKSTSRDEIQVKPAPAVKKAHKSTRAAPSRGKDSTPLRPRPASAPPRGTPADTSKHIVAGPTVAIGGREVYGELTDAVTMARPWNESGARIITVPTAAPSRLRVRYTSNSATAAAAVEKEKRARRLAEGRSSGREVKVSKQPRAHRETTRRQLSASMSEVDLRAVFNQPSISQPTAGKKSRKKVSRTEHDKRLQRLSAPTFSSVARVLDTAGMNVGELQAIALASKDAADMISAAAAAGDSQSVDIASPTAVSTPKKKKRTMSAA